MSPKRLETGAVAGTEAAAVQQCNVKNRNIKYKTQSFCQPDNMRRVQSSHGSVLV